MRKNALIAALFALAVFAFAGNSSANAQEQQTNTPNNQPNTVVVQPGDSLSKIATGKGTTYNRLFDANTQIADPDVIHPGDNIRIPTSDEQLAARPIPGDAPAPTAAQPAAPAPKTRTSPAPQGAAVSGGVWDRLAQCEAGGNWAINTGNGYFGGLQFSLSSWRAVGGSGYPHQASKSEQIARGEMLKARQGWGAWPSCSAKLGLR